MAELFQKDVRTINEHLVNIYDESELAREATIRTLRIVQTEDLERRAKPRTQSGAPHSQVHFSHPQVLDGLSGQTNSDR